MNSMIKNVAIFTDGACSGNPGPGGYGVVLRYKGIEKQLSGGAKQTTNNRMELTAVVESLSALKKPCEVTLYTDSKYIVDAIQKEWVYKWEKNNWMRDKKNPALNSDIWKELLKLLKIHNVTFIWVKGHAGHRENEICDTLAVQQSEKYRNML